MKPAKETCPELHKPLEAENGRILEDEVKVKMNGFTNRYALHLQG